MTEKDKVNEVKVKKKGEWKPYIKVGVTAFVTIAASILFFFFVFRQEDISQTWDKVLKSAEPIIFGLALAYLLMPVKKFIEQYSFKFLSSKIKKEEKALFSCW